MAFLSTHTVMEALETRLKETRFPADLVDDDGNASELAGELIFEAVTKSDSPNLGLILTRLIAVTERIAAIVPGVEQFKEDGNTGRLQRVQRFTLLYSTQDFDPFEDPAFFSETGVLRISEMVVKDLLRPFGEPRSPLRMARVRPLRGGSQLVISGEGRVKDADQAEESREVYFLEIEATMGTEAVCR